MKLIVLDFIARWRWVIFGYVIAVLAFTIFDRGVPFAIVAMMCFMADWQKGMVRVVRPLPVTIRQQALSWWFVSVGLLPALGLATIVIGLWLGGRMPFLPHEFAQGFTQWKDKSGYLFYAGAGRDPWFSVAFGWWVGLGASALLYLLQVIGPGAYSSVLMRRIWMGVVGVVLGLGTPGMMMLLFFGPQNRTQMIPAYWVACATVPLWVVWSFATAFRRSHPMMASTMQVPLPGAEAKVAVPVQRGLGGMPSLLVMMHARLLIMLCLIVCMFYIIILYMMDARAGRGADLGSPMSLQLIMMAGISCAMCGDIWNMRTLRTLPLSTAKLALILISVPLMLGVAVACLSPLGVSAVHAPVRLTQVCAEGLLTAMLGTICLTAGLYLTARRRIFFFAVLIPLMACGPIFGMKWLTQRPPANLNGVAGVASGWFPDLPVLTITAAVIVMVCYALIYLGLRRSSSFYKLRQLPGAWGQVATRG